MKNEAPMFFPVGSNSIAWSSGVGILVHFHAATMFDDNTTSSQSAATAAERQQQDRKVYCFFQPWKQSCEILQNE